MNSNEWALIIFTILSQMSVGAFVVLGAVHFFVTRKAGEQEADRMSDRVMIAIIITLGLGLAASIFHLGNPINAPLAITHIATSWLSREILLGIIFGLLGFIFVGLQWFKKGTTPARNALAVITAVVGLGLIYVQAKAYMLPAQPAWNSLATPISFYTTTLLLGVVAIGAALISNYAVVQKKFPDSAELQHELLRGSIRWLAMASVVLVGIELVVAPVYLASLSTSSAAAQASLGLYAGTYSGLFILRLVIGFVGAAVVGAFLYRNATNCGMNMLANLAYGAFALVLVAEVMGRFLFYATSFRIGL